MITRTQDGRIARLQLDRPPVNALSTDLLSAAAQTFTEVGRDPDIDGVLLVGGERCFSAGLDLRQVAELDRAGLVGLLDGLDAALLALFALPKPVAAAVAGHAIAGGLVLTLACDHAALAPGTYKLGLTELAVGVPFPRSAYEVCAHALTPRATRQLMQGAGLIGPQDAFDLGVGDVLVDRPEDAARTWLAEVTSRPLAAYRILKQQQREAAIHRIARPAPAEREALIQTILSPPCQAALQQALAR